MKYGPNTETVEAFIRHLEGMTKEDWRVVLAASDASAAAWDAALDAVRDATRYAAWDAAVEVAVVARYATYEILGASFMRKRGQPFYFLPMFGFSDPEAVLANDKKEMEQ